MYASSKSENIETDFANRAPLPDGSPEVIVLDLNVTVEHAK